MKMSSERNKVYKVRRVCEKTVWQNPRRGKKLKAEQEDSEKATKIDPNANCLESQKK